MSVLVSGCAGFIGSHLCEKLIEMGETVYGCDNLSSGSIENIRNIENDKHFHFKVCDITDYLCSEKPHNVDTVYHLAACKKLISDINPAACIETNIRQTYELMEWAKNNKVKKFVHSSTGSVYGRQAMISVLSQTNPVSYYGINKFAAESYLKFFPYNSIILRYFHVYGHRNRLGVIGKWITAIKKDEPIILNGDGTQQRTFTHVDDVVNANLFLVKPGIYNVSAEKKITLNEVIHLLEKISGNHIEVIHEDWTPGDVKMFNVIENTKMKYKVFKDELIKLWETWDTA